MRALIVEDEDRLARSLERGLREAAWTVDATSTVAEAWRLVKLNPYDAIVLDLGLPDADGSVLLQKLREARIDTPVLILTARGSVEDRVAGLNAGADDYLSKPFAFAELLARLQTLLRRSRNASTLLQVADLEVDVAPPEGPARRPSYRADVSRVRRARIPRPAFGRGRHPLDARRPRLGGAFRLAVELIEVFITRIRKKIERDGAPRLLHTIRGAGYSIREPEPE